VVNPGERAVLQETGPMRYYNCLFSERGSLYTRDTDQDDLLLDQE